MAKQSLRFWTYISKDYIFNYKSNWTYGFKKYYLLCHFIHKIDISIMSV